MGAKQRAEAKKELDRLFKRIYEDNANGKLFDSRFQMLFDELRTGAGRTAGRAVATE